MRKIDTIMQLSKTFLNNKQLSQLENILETVLEPSHVDIGDDELIQIFCDRIRMRNFSEGTIENYTRKLTMLSASCASYFLEMTGEDLESFLSQKAAEGLTPSTLNNYIGCFRSFFNWLVKFEYISINPMNKVDTIRLELKVPETFNREEIETMREYFDNLRDRALLETFLGSGMRISELCKVRISDVNFNVSPATIIVNGKGKKQRIVAVSEIAVLYLKKYILSRGLDLDSNESLFIQQHTRKIKPLTQTAIKQMFAKASQATGIHIHAHKFRRSFATEISARGMALQNTQKLLGHSQPSTTMRYVRVKDNIVMADFNRVSNF